MVGLQQKQVLHQLSAANTINLRNKPIINLVSVGIHIDVNLDWGRYQITLAEPLQAL